MATAADRLARVEALVAHLRAAYPDEGFSLHESVAFAGDFGRRGVGLPGSERICTGLPATPTAAPGSVERRGGRGIVGERSEAICCCPPSRRSIFLFVDRKVRVRWRDRRAGRRRKASKSSSRRARRTTRARQVGRRAHVSAHKHFKGAGKAARPLKAALS